MDIHLPIKISGRASISFSKASNQLAIFQTARSKDNSFVGEIQVLSFYSKDRLKFIAETSKTFKNIQNSRTLRPASNSSKKQKQILNEDLLRNSIHSNLAQYISQISIFLASPSIPASEVEIFKSTKAIFSLCETLYFNTQQSVSELLLNWLNTLFPTINPEIITEINNFHPFPRSHPEFWSLITKSFLRGQFSFAIELLGTVNGGISKLLLKCLQEMPVQSNFKPKGSSIQRVSSSNNEHRFLESFEKWKKNCEYYFDIDVLESLKDEDIDVDVYYSLFGILVGDEAAVKRATSDWKEYLIALIVYKFPLIAVTDIPDIFKNIDFSIHSPLDSKNATVSEKAMFAFFQGDTAMAIRHCSKIDSWLVTHLTDVLHTAGFLDEIEEYSLFDFPVASQEEEEEESQQQISLREWFILDYVLQIQGIKSIWNCWLTYLIYCPTLGRAYISELVDTIPAAVDGKGQQRLEKVILFCLEHGLVEEMQRLDLVLGRRFFNKRDYAGALNHYARAGSFKSVEFISKVLIDLEFKTFEKTNTTTTVFEDNNDHLISNILGQIDQNLINKIKPLLFLQKYYEFKAFVSNKQAREAGNLLCLLFTSGVAPHYLWSRLMEDVMRMLRETEVEISNEETYELMRCLEEVLGGGRGYGGGLEFGLLAEVRIALVMNLAKSVLEN